MTEYQEIRSKPNWGVIKTLGITLLFLAIIIIISRIDFANTSSVNETYPSRITVFSRFGCHYDSPCDTTFMVLVPAGEFIMGSENGDFDEKPAHTVYLEAFYIDEFEVTNYQYSICVEEGACRAPERIGETFMTSEYYGDPQYDDYPINTVNWFMADTYCRWRKARLPTEAEWEKAARGTDGRTYPWGEGINCEYANYKGCANHPVDVGSYENAKSIYGVYDMAGNVWEWVSTMYQHYPYQEHFDIQITEYENNVARGGSWKDDPEALRTPNRTYVHPWLAYHYTTIGFRCALSAEPQ